MGLRSIMENEVKPESYRGLRTISHCTVCTKKQSEWCVFSNQGNF